MLGFVESHYREVPQWEISMEQELRFGPVGITEKNGPIMSNFRGLFFHVFMGKKNENKK